MYGRWWAYYMQARMRHVTEAQPSRNTQRGTGVAFDHTDDLWIFVRLALVLAVFSAGVACILWVAS